MKSLFCSFLLLVPVVASAATQKFDVRSGTCVTMELPPRWHAQKPTPTELGGLNVYAEGPKGAVCVPAIVGQILYREKGMMDTERKLVGGFQNACRDIAAGSVEKTIRAKKLKLKREIGFYCEFTDESLVGRAKGDRDAQVATRYVVVLSDSVMVLVTVYTDDKDGAAWNDARDAMQSLVIADNQT